MPIESIFFDFDGTLQGFENHSISSSTAEALVLLKQKGYRLFIATGRNMLDLPEELSVFGFEGYINNNGGMCSDENRVPFSVTYIDRTDIDALLAYDAENPFAFSFMTEKDFTINRVDDIVKESFDYFGLEIPEIVDPSSLDLDKVLQMNFFIDEEYEKYLMQNVMKNSDSSRWINLFADINPKGISKMKGINQMATRYNLDLNKTMAFGDGGNDIPMLQGCAIGVAMGNAKDNVQKVANYVTTSADEDGIWNALKYYNLI